MSEIAPEGLARALADPTRLRLLMLLHNAKRELCVCELTAALDLSQPKISRHLGALRDAGLVRVRRSGRWVYYRLEAGMPGWAAFALQAFADGTRETAPYAADLARLNRQAEAPGCT